MNVVLYVLWSTIFDSTPPNLSLNATDTLYVFNSSYSNAVSFNNITLATFKSGMGNYIHVTKWDAINLALASTIIKFNHRLIWGRVLMITSDKGSESYYFSLSKVNLCYLNVSL